MPVPTEGAEAIQNGSLTVLDLCKVFSVEAEAGLIADLKKLPLDNALIWLRKLQPEFFYNFGWQALDGKGLRINDFYKVIGVAQDSANAETDAIAILEKLGSELADLWVKKVIYFPDMAVFNAKLKTAHFESKPLFGTGVFAGIFGMAEGAAGGATMAAGVGAAVVAERTGELLKGSEQTFDASIDIDALYSAIEVVLQKFENIKMLVGQGRNDNEANFRFAEKDTDTELLIITIRNFSVDAKLPQRAYDEKTVRKVGRCKVLMSGSSLEGLLDKGVGVAEVGRKALTLLGGDKIEQGIEAALDGFAKAGEIIDRLNLPNVLAGIIAKTGREAEMLEERETEQNKRKNDTQFDIVKNYLSCKFCGQLRSESEKSLQKGETACNSCGGQLEARDLGKKQQMLDDKGKLAELNYKF